MPENDLAIYALPTHIQSRSISFENPTGAVGAGGAAASPLGVGRKGDPVRHLQPGETLCLANICGPGIIRHIWLTTHALLPLLRGVVIRFYWDQQNHPSIEAPVGDFFGFAHGNTPAFETAVHSVSEKLGMNFWQAMPFAKHVRVEIENQSTQRMPLFYQIDYTIGDKVTNQDGYLHANFNRQNNTQAGEDLVLLQRQNCRGRYLGAVIGIIPKDPRWWGEGELKIYLDGDTEYATIVGTGAEDYVGLSWGIQQNAFLYHGANWREKDDISDTGAVSMYRWHIKDPIYWQQDIRVSIQQIGHSPDGATTIDEYKHELYEREDDWCVTAFWYQSLPSAPLPMLPNCQQRMADLSRYFVQTK